MMPLTHTPYRAARDGAVSICPVESPDPTYTVEFKFPAPPPRPKALSRAHKNIPAS